jgi:Uma2 family endonuclease
MTTSLTPIQAVVTLADLLERLGGISPNRVRFNPHPGTATHEDVTSVERKENRLFELVDGTLVEKVMGYREAILAAAVAAALRDFVVPRKLGFISGADGMIRLYPDLVRIPDVAFVSRGRLPGGKVPEDPAPQLVPDLAVEILSRGNTAAEMGRKRGEYFDAGVRLVWLIDFENRSATVYTSPLDSSALGEDDSLDGGEVLPGFTLPLRGLFAELET